MSSLLENRSVRIAGVVLAVALVVGAVDYILARASPESGTVQKETKQMRPSARRGPVPQTSQ